MSYKCRICGSNEVDNPGDICELCAIGQDPYAAGIGSAQYRDSGSNSDSPATSAPIYSPKRSSNRRVLLKGGAPLQNTDPYGNDISETESPASVKVYSAGQTPTVSPVNNSSVIIPAAKVSSNQPITTGVTKNITVDNQKKSIISKWFRALFSGIPFTIDDDVTMFQVFPDFTGTSLNALGNACDQVIVYGRLNNGAVSENNDVEVYGRRDSNNNIIAKSIRNTASGTTITPQRCIGVGVVWVITLLVVGLIVGAVSALGVEGIIWAVVIILLLTNFPKVIKIAGVILGALFSFLKRLF